MTPQNKQNKQIENKNETQIISSKPQYLPYIFVVFIFLISGFLYFIPQRNLDNFFLMAQGRRTVQEHKIPTNDIFSFGETRKYIINSQWLSEVVFYLMYQNFGSNSLLVLKTILGLLTSFFIFWVIFKETKNLYLSSLFIFFLAVMIMYFYNIRPQIFTYTLMGFLIFILHQYFKGKSFYAYFLLVLIPVWAALHGGFVTGVGLVFLIIVLEYIKIFFPSLPFNLSKNTVDKKILNKLLLFLFISCAFLLLTPGFKGRVIFLNPKLQSSEGSGTELVAELTEWEPLIPKNVTNFHLFIWFVISFLIVISVFKKMDLKSLGAWFAVNILPFKAQKFIPFAVIPSINITALSALYLSKEIKFKRKFSPFIIFLFYFLLVIFVLIYLFLFPFKWVYKLPALPESKFERIYLPFDAVDFIKLNKLPGRMYNDLGWGGFIIWKLYPQYKVMVDGRYGAAYTYSFLNDYLKTLKATPGTNYEKFLDKWKISFVFLPKIRNLAGALNEDKNWVPIYDDELSVIFIKNIPENKKIISAAKYYRLKYPDSIRFYLYQGYINLRRKQIDVAEMFLKRAINKEVDNLEANYNLGMVYLFQGYTKRAEIQFKRVIETNSEYIDAYNSLAKIYLENKDYKSAKIILSKAIKTKTGKKNEETIALLKEVNSNIFR